MCFITDYQQLILITTMFTWHFYAQKALDLRINIHLLTKQRPMPENLTGYIDQFP